MSRISVCIATYNGEKYIKEQLTSILSQLNEDDELIISDDSSSDRTISIIKEFKDKRIKLFSNQTFSSPIYNFENAIKNATGDYIFLSDQDDVWFPQKVSTMLMYLPNYDLVVSDCKVVNADLKVIYDSFFEKLSSGTGFWKNLAKNTYLGCCMGFRREILSYILPFPKKIAMHDIWIGLSVELNGSSYFLGQPLMVYRRHEENASFASEKSGLSFSYKIRYRLDMLFALLRRRVLHK